MASSTIIRPTELIRIISPRAMPVSKIFENAIAKTVKMSMITIGHIMMVLIVFLDGGYGSRTLKVLSKTLRLIFSESLFRARVFRSKSNETSTEMQAMMTRTIIDAVTSI